MHYELLASDPIAGSRVQVVVSADTTPPNVAGVLIVHKSIRKERTVMLDIEIDCDSIRHSDDDRLTIGVGVIVSGSKRSSQRENLGFIFSRYDPPFRTFTVSVPWFEKHPVRHIELTFLTDDDGRALTNDAGFEIER